MNHINGRIEDNNRYIENMQKYIVCVLFFSIFAVNNGNSDL